MVEEKVVRVLKRLMNTRRTWMESPCRCRGGGWHGPPPLLQPCEATANHVEVNSAACTSRGADVCPLTSSGQSVYRERERMNTTLSRYG